MSNRSGDFSECYWLCLRWARVARADRGAIMMGCFVTQISFCLRVWNPARLVYDSVRGGKGTRLDLDVMVHMKLVEKRGDSFHIVGSREESSDDEEAEDAGDINMEEGNSNHFRGLRTSSGVGTSRAGPSFQRAFDLSNDEVLARRCPKWTCLMPALMAWSP
ncbi:hypothetical protein JCGZ_08350 [Jatropha curcas]|uniref:Uncharacterized protein n=1 Tax=Jatropha curcas TaxID=180498 RepID=A0A067KNJ6_JATCU|nr:hypothetical protein JCGZ_08350 [Jatropha curcas]